jgi:Fe-S cluster assembly iron-binding protein IscA
MKTTYLFTVLLLCINTNKAATIESNSKGRIGRKSSGCNGLGICLAANANEGELNLIFRYDNTNAKLSIVIDEKEVINKQIAAIDYLRRKNNFVLDEDVVLPPKIVTSLTLKNPLLPKGNYPLQYQDGKFIVTITR